MVEDIKTKEIMFSPLLQQKALVDSLAFTSLLFSLEEERWIELPKSCKNFSQIFLENICYRLKWFRHPSPKRSWCCGPMWCNQWKLRLNWAKFAAMRMSLSPNTDDNLKPEYLLELDHAIIATPDSQRDLGIASSRNLSWSTHYSVICRKAYNIQ